MKLRHPNGAIIEVPEGEQAEKLLGAGFKPLAAEAPEEPKKQPRKRVAKPKEA